jgi:formate/nitrite transporter FocA (FNT family)
METVLETYCPVTCKYEHSVVNDFKFLFLLFLSDFFTDVKLLDLLSYVG